MQEGNGRGVESKKMGKQNVRFVFQVMDPATSHLRYDMYVNIGTAPEDLVYYTRGNISKRRGGARPRLRGLGESKELKTDTYLRMHKDVRRPAPFFSPTRTT